MAEATGAVAVVAHVRVHPGRGDELLALLDGWFDEVRAEPGTLVYTFARDRQDPDVFWVYERYESMEAFRTHAKAAATFIASLQDLLAEGPEIQLADDLGGVGV